MQQLKSQQKARDKLTCLSEQGTGWSMDKEQSEKENRTLALWKAP